MPFAVARREGVLHLTLDTPGSAINIFNHATANQLIELLADVTRDNTRAIVFETAKPQSFINGVGLLLAHASQTADDIQRAGQAPWAAYRAVHTAPVPTIAVIQGSCFGCGVEFALNCDFRLASDSGETDFYMTELNDYLFIPLFGSTWNLPAAVGLADAIDLLLWGQHWDASTAYARGLVDAVADRQRLEQDRDAFIERVLAGTQPSRRRGRVVWDAATEASLQRAQARVAGLPPLYQPVYGDALRLLESGARQLGSYDTQQAHELRCSAASALSPIGKAAYSFFYLRQMASQRAAGRPRPAGDRGVRLHLRDTGASPLFDDLRHRRLAGVDLVADGEADLLLVAGDDGATPTAGEVGVLHTATAVRHRAAEIYAPALRSGLRFAELAITPADDDGSDAAESDANAARLVRVLQRSGFAVARTRATGTFVSNHLLAAYFAPLLQLDAAGVPVATLNATLRAAGFVRRPADLVDALGIEPLAEALAPLLDQPQQQLATALARLAQHAVADDDHEEPRVLDTLCVSLLAAVVGAKHRGDVGDVPTIDLIARELLDFPRHLCSLGSWLKTQRVAAALAQRPALDHLVAENAWRTAEDFVTAAREIYR